MSYLIVLTLTFNSAARFSIFSERRAFRICLIASRRSAWFTCSPPLVCSVIGIIEVKGARALHH